MDEPTLDTTARTEPPTPELLELLAGWMPARRWYPVKGSVVRPVPWVSYALPAPDGLSVEVHLLRLVGGGVDVLVQVPLVWAPTGEGGDAGADQAAGGTVIGTVVREDGASLDVHDGAAHPAFWAAVLDLAEWADGVPHAPHDLDLGGARALAVEQSNSSVMLPGVSGGGMLKVVRALAVGPNPDVVIPRALAAHGFAGSPRPLAWLTAGWEDSDTTTSTAGALTAHLAVLTELVTGATDGFDLACDHARRGEPLDEQAAALGRDVAAMHQALAEAFEPGDPLDTKWLVDELRARAETATTQADVLVERHDRIRGFHDETVSLLAQSGATTTLQRIHGDLHLGQALHGESGWKILDFEGEPMRSVAERARPDVALRDVAGMLRSFDYAAAVGGATDPAWASSAQTAFLEAYRTAAGVTGDEARAAEALLRALLLDKALYEVVYETRNRPDWLPIPLAAVDRLLAGGI
ncbi:hypothetical protein GCM10025865_22900 [Paraoerskovia sediminicola]|uniref:Maltokinase n=1 Tax=Paraoerskovia sediminicola TaxID=1138587 RepID=A0ABN6XH79_9CELL|nr:phosphotransferase [Paraoerskovia sediminicola]BDZ42991.1 hypothetical protein GCM10025865_22900 [Paraoerskovia sediminicola]